MREKDIKSNFSKICCLAYDFQDVQRLVDFCCKHNYKYYYIKHNDYDENIEDIKTHYHFIIESDSYHRFNIKSLLTDNFKINLFQKLDSVKSYLRYMLHLDYDMKEKYTLNDIISNVDLNIIENLINDTTKSKQEETDENFKKVMQYIFNEVDNGVILNLRDIIEYCIDNKLTYKASWSFTIINLLKLL